ncbi:hypothetical protein FRC04_000174 [Tulasnella sp. 424]|nr:hypothetical protein FRC04_000174 [Tulasnella sp. 424]KAG8982037.1 hypothetical protein FRC05_000179 [Tulasnella sp. 425]
MFANITQADKEAFFGLLDEYFATRGGVAAVAAAKGPAGQQALSRLQSSATHLKSDFVGKHFGTGGATSSTATSAEPAASAASGHADASSSDRPSFASLRGAFSNASTTIMSGASAAGLGRSNTTAAGTGGPKVPPPVAPRNRFQAPAPTQPPPEPEEEEDPPPPVIPKRTVAAPAPAPRGIAGLQSGKHFGNSKIDITSGGSMVSSMFGSKKAPTTTGIPSLPPSSAPKSNYSFAPPPARRAPSSTGTESPAASTPPPPPPPPPPPTRAAEPEEEGEWVEALYEYSSDDKADLQFDTGARIKVLEHTSDDWWTGELKGKQGLFPATYVKTL